MPRIRRRNIFAIASVVAVVASTLVGANVVSADSVWVQSYERTSQTQACAAQPGETPWQASWGTNSSWSPSWEQWANNGTGGWVCTRSITWARSESSARSYALGDIGPGGGLVFLISGGLTYEMAPKAWSAGSVNETTPVDWCNNASLDVTGAVGTAVGTGSTNTTAIDAACTSGAGQSATDYAGGGYTDWFLPSQDELNAMCYYSRNLSASPDPTVSCDGGSLTTQNATFAIGTYGFAGLEYWSSSQNDPNTAWLQNFDNGGQDFGFKIDPLPVLRPIRAF